MTLECQPIPTLALPLKGRECTIDCEALHYVLSFPFKGKAGMGMGE